VTAKQKFATFHDLRRSCAHCLAQDMLPQDLQEFMRHSSLQVTMEYYVGHRPAEVAKRMWSNPDRKNAVVSRDEISTIAGPDGAAVGQSQSPQVDGSQANAKQ
jgi:hypothetical protein